MLIKIKRLDPKVKMPNYAHPGDVGMDMYSREEDYVLQPGERHFFYCGFAMEFEPGYVAMVKDRSSMSKNGLHCIGGVFDAGYRGEYNVNLVNLSDQPYTVEKHDKIAQLVVIPVARASVEMVDELGDSSRGHGAFGSTGRK